MYDDRQQHEVQPLLMEKEQKLRSVFAPGNRIRMNIVPMFVATFLPWGVFILCCGLSSFWLNYVSPNVVTGIICAVLLFWIAWLFAAVWARFKDPDPTWFTYMAVAVGVAAIAGTACGETNFSTFSQPYYQVSDLKVANNVEPSVTPSRNVMDAGIVNFAPGSHFDVLRSWHFMNDDLYCVAPVISTGAGVSTPAFYDYWVVGKNCCSVGASDFRCGAWGSAKASSGIRVVSDSDLSNYRLAVQQAASLYSIQTPNPIFLTWSTDPTLEVASWNQQVFKNYLTQVTTALVFCVFFMCMATVRFAWLGRSASAYAADLYNGPVEDPYNQPVNTHATSYNA